MTPPVPYAVAARTLLRDTTFAAVRDLLADRDWSAVTMAQVAKGAGVSRQTLYNEFGSREELAQAFVLDEVARFVAAVRAAVTGNAHDPSAALTAAFEVFLQAAEHDPLVRAIVSGDGSDGLLALVTTQGRPVLVRATEQLTEVLLEHFPAADEGDVRLLADAVVRLAISHAALPGGPTGVTASSLGALLGPFVERAVPAPPASRP